MDHKERLKDFIREAFADVPVPRHDRLIENEWNDEAQMVRRAFMDKPDWHTIDPDFLAQAPEGLASALSFFSDEAFRFYLPAYLIADIDGKIGVGSPLFHLTYGLQDLPPSKHTITRLSTFTARECRAIIRYLDFHLYHGRETRRIKRAFDNFWYTRAYRDDSKERKHRRKTSDFIPAKDRVVLSKIKASLSWASGTVYLDSVLIADATKQNYIVSPHRYYVDSLKSCRDCQNEFIFFATEQQYWFETLGFFIGADCVRCPKCRTADQTLRRRFQRYSKNISRKDLSEEDFTTLLSDALFLFESGLLKTDQILRRLRNQACKRFPDFKISAKLAAALTKNCAKP